MAFSPIRPTDDTARTLAQNLMRSAKFAALGVIDPNNGAPFVTRISFAMDTTNQPITLISTLAFHTTALQQNPACSLLIGEPPAKGDPLAFPRMTLSAHAEILPVDEKPTLRDTYLSCHPKAKLYIDFTDFHFVRFTVNAAALNGGFGKAFSLTGTDLT
ncbi:MAG: pyridoxamine 5'-phosphate oxidase family protein [Paracoccaceae bacterium]